MLDVSLLRAGVIVILALSGGAVFTVMRLHWRAYANLPRRAGLTPLHVSLVSLGVLVLQGALGWALIESFGTAATVNVAIRTGMYGTGSLIILAALYVVGGLQRKRLQFARQEKTVIVSEVDVTSIHAARDQGKRPGKHL